jgi:hypothetical protein
MGCTDLCPFRASTLPTCSIWPDSYAFGMIHCRKCSIVRHDRDGNQYIGTCKSADMHSAHRSTVHHSSAPTVGSHKPSAASAPSMDISVVADKHSTATHDTSSDNPQHFTHLQDPSYVSAWSSLVSRAKKPFSLSGGAQPTELSNTKSHSPSQKKVLSLSAMQHVDCVSRHPSRSS